MAFPACHLLFGQAHQPVAGPVVFDDGMIRQVHADHVFYGIKHPFQKLGLGLKGSPGFSQVGNVHKCG